MANASLTPGAAYARLFGRNATSSAGLRYLVTDGLSLALAPSLATFRYRSASTSASASTSNATSNGTKTRPSTFSSGFRTRLPKYNYLPDSKRKTTRRIQKLPLPPLTRLDPARPLLPPNVSLSLDHPDTNRAGVRQRAKRLSALDKAIQTGDEDAVWKAYSELSPDDGSSESPLTPDECKRVLGVISNDATKTRRAMTRILNVMADIRHRRRRILSKLEKVAQTKDLDRASLLLKELDDWSSIVSPVMTNEILGYIGASLRRPGLMEVEDVLEQLLEFEHDGAASSVPLSSSSRAGSMEAYLHRQSVLGSQIPSILTRKRTGRKRSFPDLATYNTILNIIARTIHRHTPAYDSGSRNEADDDDRFSSITENLQDARSHTQNAALSDKLRKLDLNTEAAGPITLERADKLFNSVLQRMQRKSKIEPDRLTFNIMISMNCALDRWDIVRQIVKVMYDKGLLQVDCINNVLSKLIMRPRGYNNQDSDPIADAMEVYGLLRDNLVQVQLGKRYGAGLDASKDEQLRLAESPNSALMEDAPLLWPHEEERYQASKDSAKAANTAVSRILGIPNLPMNLVPDSITYALMIKALSHVGRFADALGVLRDLASIPIAVQGEDREAKTDHFMQPTLAIYDSFFRGFCRHGIPSRLIHYDESSPERSEWGPLEMDEPVASEEVEASSTSDPQLQMWNINTFMEIFDAFIRFVPDAGLPQLNAASMGSDKPQDPDVRLSLSADESQGALPSIVASAKKTLAPILTSYGSLTRSEARRRKQLQKAPSPNQLFWIITAIRRVSGDDARWSLAMWQKVVDKFTNECRSTEGTFAWTDFRLNDRLHRVLDFLESKVDEDQHSVDQAKGAREDST